MVTLIGMTEEQLGTLASNVRIVDRNDGVTVAITTDYRPSRANVIMENGIVTKIDGYY